MATHYGNISLPVAARERNMHLAFIDCFRALAIVLIVVEHCFVLAFGTLRGYSSPFDLILAVLTGGTALFVFVSGLLFHHIFYPRWDYSEFVRGKLTKLFLPFSVCTLVLVVLQRMGTGLPYTHFLDSVGPTNSFYVDYVFSLVSGQAGVSLWYLPFIALIFAGSPAFIRFIQATPRQRMVVLVLALMLGFTVSRPSHNVDKFQAVAYFVFYYLMGIEVSLRRDVIFPWLEQKKSLILLAIVLLAIAGIEIRYQGLLHAYGEWFELALPNIHYLQKIVLIFFLCALFTQIPSLRTTGISRLAADSFGIFFVHNLVLFILWPATSGGGPLSGNKFLDLAIWGGLVLGLSWGIVKLIQRCAGPYSRKLIGA